MKLLPTTIKYIRVYECLHIYRSVERRELVLIQNFKRVFENIDITYKLITPATRISIKRDKTYLYKTAEGQIRLVNHLKKVKNKHLKWYLEHIDKRYTFCRIFAS